MSYLIRIGFLTILFLFSKNTNASNPFYAVKNIPDSLMENANTVIRKEINTVEIKSVKEYLYTRELVVTILNDKSTYNIFFQHYDQGQDKIEEITATIYDADGNKIRKISNREIKDQSAISSFSIYEDSRVKYVEITNGTYPYTIEYKCVFKGSNYIHLPGWQPRESKTAVQSAELRAKVKKGVSENEHLNVRYETQALQQAPKIVDNPIEKSWTWKINNLKSVVSEPFGPKYYEITPSIRLSPSSIALKKWKGSMATWKEFGAFIYNLNKGRGVLSDELKATISKLTAKANTNKEKIDILYKYLQDNTRYVSVQLGIGGFQTFDAAYVEKNKYGDCKALTYFMRSMLEAVDIKAYPALINSGGERRFFDENFSYAAFNHVILTIPSENYWLECTSNHYPPNYIGDGNLNRNALLITEEGGKLVSTPKLSPEDNQTLTTTSIQLATDGSAVVTGTCSATGKKQERYRYLENSFSEKERQDWFYKAQNYTVAELEYLKIRSSQNLPDAKMKYKTKIKRYASKAGKRLFVPVNIINTIGKVPNKMEDRSHKVVLSNEDFQIDTIHITLPEGYKVESLPEKEINLQSDFAEYSSKISLSKNKLTLVRILKRKASILAAEEYNSVRNFYKNIAKSDGMKIVLVQETRP